MNIDQYREMVKQQSEQANSPSNVEEQSHVQTEPSATEPTQPSVQETPQAEPTQPTSGEPSGVPSEPSQPEVPQFLEIDGQQVSIDELRNGYLRQSDYTRKTQELARQAKEAERAQQLLEQIQANPEVAQQLQIDPQAIQNERLLDDYYGLLLEKEVNELSSKYNDFEVREVLTLAQEKNIMNLEDAYLLNKALKGTTPTQVNTTPPSQPNQTTAPVVDVESLKQELRASILAEIQAEQGTGTLITTRGGSAPTGTGEPQLSDAQLKVAKKMGLSPQEYAKYL